MLVKTVFILVGMLVELEECTISVIDRGKLTTVQVDTCTVYQKKYPSTGIPCTCATGPLRKVIFPTFTLTGKS